MKKKSTKRILAEMLCERGLIKESYINVFVRQKHEKSTNALMIQMVAEAKKGNYIYFQEFVNEVIKRNNNK